MSKSGMMYRYRSSSSWWHISFLSFASILLLTNFCIQLSAVCVDTDHFHSSKEKPPQRAPSLMASCQPISDVERAEIHGEIQHYEKSSKFNSKMQEVTGEKPLAGLHKAVLQYLEKNVLQAGFSVLDLGCAAGVMLKEVKALEKRIGLFGQLVGVELVPGWVDFASSHLQNISFFQGDITDFTLPGTLQSAKFEVVMLNDVLEHVQKARYGCLLDRIHHHTDKHSIVYMHTPSEEAQAVESGQFFENTVPFQEIVVGMAARGFQLAHFEYDFNTECGGHLSSRAPKSMRDSRCNLNHWPKYYHAMFRRTN